MATISSVRIANMALSNIGARSTIESFDEQSPEARECKLWYDWARRQTLESFDWNFASRRAALALHSEDAPKNVWTYRYQYPASCLVAREIVNPLGPRADAVPFEVENDATGEQKTILTDMEGAILRFTFDLTTPSLFSSYFVTTLSHLLGYYIAFPLTGKLDIKAGMLEVYNRLILTAPAFNANERVDRAPREAEWIRARDANFVLDN